MAHHHPKNRNVSTLLLPCLLLLAGAVFFLWKRQPEPTSPRALTEEKATAKTTPAATRWEWKNGSGSVVIDIAESGAPVRWSHGGRTWIDSPQPPAMLFERPNGSHAHFRVLKVEEPAALPGQEEASLILHGAMEGGGLRLPARLTYRIGKEAQQLTLSLKVEAPLGRVTTPVRRWHWPFAFRLDHHKAVHFQGEHGLSWETRAFYQYTVSTTGKHLLAHPDRNEWRWFGLDQLGPEAFRIWKAESETTSPLVMQHGRHLPAPQVQLFDQNGGVTLHYHQLSKTGQRALRVDTRDGGTVEVCFWSGASPGEQADTKELFGSEHEITLHAAPDEATLHAQRPEPEPPPAPEAALEEAPWVRTSPMGNDATHYVTGGYPFPQGVLGEEAPVHVAVDGEAVPVQKEVLGYWPDGTVKWAQLTFPFSPTKAREAVEGPRITSRNGQAIPVIITPNRPPSTNGSTPHLKTSQNEDGVTVENGPLQIRFTRGRDWLHPSWEGKPLLAPGGDHRLAYADYLLSPQRLAPMAVRAQGGEVKPETFSIAKVTLEESGALRTVVRLEGSATKAARIILRATVQAGRPEIALEHSIEFLFDDPRTTFLSALGLELPLAGLNPRSVAFGGAAADPKVTTLLAETFDSRQRGNRAMFRPTTGDGGWVEGDLADGVRFTGVIRHFAESAPKALSLGENGALLLELWPRNAPPMDGRRYSDYPHRSQGEATGENDDWVQTDYYREQPFVGITRSHHLLLAFQPAATAQASATLAADFQSPPLLYAGWPVYEAAAVTLPVSKQEAWPRVWAAWTRYAQFWLHHQSLHRWYGFWNHGDFRHRFQDGYGWFVSPEATAAALTHPERELPPETPLTLDYQPANDWAFDNGRWGWGNTEGLPGLFFSHEYLRHGNRAVYFAMEALARHSRDVVLRHSGPWLGLGTRHGVQPWSDGNHEERQTAATEYRLHYFLSGEGRTREVAEKLFQAKWNATPTAGEASHSGRWGGLFFHAELSGDPEEFAQLQRYAHHFIAPNGLYLNPQVGFPGPEVLKAPESLNANRMFFHQFGAMHFLLEYQQTFADAKLAKAIIAMADATLAPTEEPIEEINFIAPLAFAAMHASNPRPYREHLLKSLREDHWRRLNWRTLYQSVTENPKHWSGPSGFLHRNVSGSWFFNNWAAYLTASLGEDTLWGEAIADRYREMEKRGQPKEKLPLWRQVEWETLHGPVADYLNRQKPWRNAPPAAAVHP